MIRMNSDRLIEDYLRRLESAAAHLPRARRAELVAEIREHIRAGVGEEGAAGDAAVLNVLERLGSPDDIVGAADQPLTSSVRPRWIDVVALVGLVLPFLGWVVGSILVLVSDAWSRRDKVIGLLLLAVPILALGIGLTATARQGVDEPVPAGDQHPVGVQQEAETEDPALGGLILVVSGVPSSLYLAWRLRAHSGAQPSEVR
jgi:hypothetical protein